MIKKDNFYNEDFDIHTYMNKKFINSDDIKNITHEQNINLISYDDKIFRFMSVTDIIDSKKITICILKDITQSTLIQNKLKESEQRYRNLMDILNDGVIIHNMNTISYINTSAKEIFSLDKNSDKIWLIDDINNQLNIQYREKFLKSINMIQTGKKDKVSVKVETEEGKIIEFISTSIILNEKQMVISLAIDITNSEKTMMELEQTEKTYKLLLQTLPEGIAIIDKKTKNHVYRNKAMIKLLKNIGADDLSKVVNDYIEKKEFGKFKKISINSDKKHDISIAIIDILEEGTYLVVIRNLENTVKIEKMVEKLSEIKAKYKFKTEFLANVTQDIKRPINIISNVNNILDINKEKYNSENVNNYIKAVRQNCNRLLRILENTEEIEAIENGNYKMNYSKVNIVKLIKNIVKISKVYTDEKGLKVNFTTNINNKILFIDKSKMEKVILNILANAIKFTPSGGTINIDIKVINSKVHISIKDSGVGIPQDKINVIFENFEQVDRTLTRGAEGTGIGLALTQKLVQLHDGKIVVTSEIGLGSNFEIILNDNEFDKVFDNIKFFDNSIDKEKIDLEFSDIYLI
jgi:signal transduction histidine kinase/PAS domain-containing protein